METIRVGVIGCGVMGKLHARHLNEHPAAEVVAVADVRAGLAEDLAREHNVPRVYPNGEALLEDAEVDAVTLALPTCWRTELALKAFAKGKHVLTEKPVAMSAEEVRHLIAAKGDLIAGCCSCRYHYYPSNQATADVIASGTLGRIRSIHGRHMMRLPPRGGKAPPAWRLNKSFNGGGILMNWGCYDLDFILWITGWQLNPQRVFAQAWPVPEVFADRPAPDSDAETHFTALIRCAEGEMITLERAEYVTTTPGTAYKIVGDRASLHLGMTPAEGKQVVLDKADGENGLVSSVIWESAEMEDGAIGHAGPVHDFIDAIREHRPCRTSLERSLVIQQISDGIYASAETGETVRLQQPEGAVT